MNNIAQTPTRVISSSLTQEQNSVVPSQNERITLTLQRTFNQRIEDLAHEFANGHLELQGEINQFNQKLRETDPQDQKRITWILCILINDVIEASLRLAGEQEVLRKQSLLNFYKEFKKLLQEIQPEGLMADQVLSRYVNYKNNKEIQDQRLIDITEIATQKLEEACQFANETNHAIIENFEVLIGRIKVLNQKRQTLQLDHQRKLDELSQRAYAALQEIQNLTRRQGQVDRNLKADEQAFDKTLQSVEGLLDRLQRL